MPTSTPPPPKKDEGSRVRILVVSANLTAVGVYSPTASPTVIFREADGWEIRKHGPVFRLRRSRPKNDGTFPDTPEFEVSITACASWVLDGFLTREEAERAWFGEPAVRALPEPHGDTDEETDADAAKLKARRGR